MSTTDPLHDAFEELARRADLDVVPDRLAGIAGKRRAQRNRRTGLAAGVAALAVVAAGATLVERPPGDGRTSAVAGAVRTSSQAGPHLTVTRQVSPDQTPARGDFYRVGYVVTGTAVAVREQRTGGEVAHGNPLSTRLLLDGKELGGTDSGDVECDPTGEVETYDHTFSPVVVPIEPGDHTVRVEAFYCSTDGQVRTASDSSTSYFLGSEKAVDRLQADLDGDGTSEELVVSDEGTDSALHVSGSVDGTVSLAAAEPVGVSDVVDLDGDGDREVLVEARWRSDTATVVVTLDDGRPAQVTSPPSGPRRYSGAVDDDFHGTQLIDGVLTTWEGPGDGDRVGPVEGGTWVLEGTRLRLVPFGEQTCGSVRVSPRPC
jgi:hypothetical protein